MSRCRGGLDNRSDQDKTANTGRGFFVSIVLPSSLTFGPVCEHSSLLLAERKRSTRDGLPGVDQRPGYKGCFALAYLLTSQVVTIAEFILQCHHIACKLLDGCRMAAIDKRSR